MNPLMYRNVMENLGVILLLILLRSSAISGNEETNWMADYSDESPTTYKVSLRLRGRDAIRFGAGHVCSGALISDNKVLTAAHCFVDQTKYDGSFMPKSDFKVVAGGIHRFVRTSDTMSFPLDELHMQQTVFNMSTYDKDIAVIVIIGLMPKFMQPIQLLETALISHKSCQISGWSPIDEYNNLDEQIPYNVTLIEENVCRRVSGILSQHLIPGMLCVGNLNHSLPDACRADSGGPLVCAGRLAGIGSLGIKCGLPRLPGVYTDVVFYRKWIDEIPIGGRWKRVGAGILRSSGSSLSHFYCMPFIIYHSIVLGPFGITHVGV